MCQRSDRSYFQEPPELDSLISTGKLVQTSYLSRLIGRLHNQPLPQRLIFVSSQNKLSSTKTAICEVETLAEKYILLDSLLFKLVTTPKREQYY